MLCSQAWAVAVSGSYAYVTADQSDALVVVDIGNPASPVIRGSVASSSLMNYVRAAWSFARADGLGRRGMRPLRLSCSRPRRHRLLIPSRAHALALAHRRLASP